MTLLYCMAKISLASKSMGIESPVNISEEYYPEFHYSGEQKLDIPDEGVMEIRYKKTSSSERKGRDGKTRYECSIEVRDILETEEDDEVEAPAKSGSESEDALDEILESLKELKETDKKVHEEMK